MKPTQVLLISTPNGTEGAPKAERWRGPRTTDSRSSHPTQGCDHARKRRTYRRKTFLALALFLPACTTILAPDLVGERTPLVPTPMYAAAHAHAEACTGHRYPFADLKWYRVAEIRQGGRRFLGSWEKPGTILLAEGCEDCPAVVYHELLHAVLQRGHPGDGWTGAARACEDAWREVGHG